MKKRIIIGELEREQIKTMHESYKKFLKEESRMINEGLLLLEDPNDPVPTGDALIEKIKQIDPQTGKAFCSVADGATDYSINNQKALFKTATTTGKLDVNTTKPKYVPGDKLIIKSDYSYDVYDGPKWNAGNYKDSKKGTYRWKCPALTAQQTAQQQQVVQSYQTQGTWQTFDQLTNKSQANDPNVYTQKQVSDGKGGTITLYLPKGQGYSTGTYAAGTPQAKYLDLIKTTYGLTVEPAPGDENAQPIDPPKIGGYDPATMFPAGFKVYQSLQNLSSETFQGATTALANMTPQEANCFTILDNYFGYFNGGDNPPIPGSEFQVQQLKTAVEGCKRAYLNKWTTDTQTPPKEPGALAGRKKKAEYQTAKSNYDKIVNALNIIKLFTREIATYKQKSAPGRRNQLFAIPK